jgi:hypothetical protein
MLDRERHLEHAAVVLPVKLGRVDDVPAGALVQLRGYLRIGENFSARNGVGKIGPPFSSAGSTAPARSGNRTALPGRRYVT